VVAVPLAVEVAEKLPHAELPQVTDHETPLLALSLLTTAVRLAFAPVFIDAGAAGLNVNEITGGFGGLGPEPDPPQPAISITRRTKAIRYEDRRSFISHSYREQQDLRKRESAVTMCESESRSHYGQRSPCRPP
jgi:hypothetical protein